VPFTTQIHQISFCATSACFFGCDERFHCFLNQCRRTLKYEHIYLTDCTTGLELVAGLSNYFDFCSHDRFHQGLDHRTPAQVYGINQVSLVQ